MGDGQEISGPFGVADEVDRERDRIGLVYRIRNRVKAYEATVNVLPSV